MNLATPTANLHYEELSQPRVWLCCSHHLSWPCGYLCRLGCSHYPTLFVCRLHLRLAVRCLILLARWREHRQRMSTNAAEYQWMTLKIDARWSTVIQMYQRLKPGRQKVPAWIRYKYRDPHLEPEE